MGSDAFTDKLELEKSRSTLQLLFKAARLLNERALEEARRRMNKPVRLAHTTLLPHVDLDGTRLTEIARRLGVTKQAAGELVDELVEMKLLERVTDPADARAKLVRFSARGRAGLLDGLAILRELEDDLAKHVGEKKMRIVHDALAAIVAAEEMPEK